MNQPYQIFDLFGEPVYFRNLDECIAECERRLDSYPHYEIDDDFDERRLKACQHRLIRQQNRHLLNQLYLLRGTEIRLRGEMRFAFPDQPQQVIHASVLDELPDNGLIVRYWIPDSPSPITREVFLEEVRLVSLTYQPDQNLHPELHTHMRPMTRKWGMSQAQTAMPVHSN